MYKLRSFFQELKDARLQLCIVTKGYVGVCQHILEAEGLLAFFQQVFGSVGKARGESIFDRSQLEPSQWEGTSESELNESKVSLIHRLMSEASFTADEICLVDGSAEEIASVQGVCRGILVNDVLRVRG